MSSKKILKSEIQIKKKQIKLRLWIDKKKKNKQQASKQASDSFAFI